jgi:CTP synthase
MQIMELPQSPRKEGGVAHPFFIGGQFHPELTSRPLRPQPMFMGLVAAAVKQKFGDAGMEDAAVARWIKQASVQRQPA